MYVSILVSYQTQITDITTLHCTVCYLSSDTGQHASTDAPCACIDEEITSCPPLCVFDYRRIRDTSHPQILIDQSKSGFYCCLVVYHASTITSCLASSLWQTFWQEKAEVHFVLRKVFLIQWLFLPSNDVRSNSDGNYI